MAWPISWKRLSRVDAEIVKETNEIEDVKSHIARDEQIEGVLDKVKNIYEVKKMEEIEKMEEIKKMIEVKTAERVKSMEEVKKITPVKSIEEVQSMTPVKSIQEVTKMDEVKKITPVLQKYELTPEQVDILRKMQEAHGDNAEALPTNT